MEQHHSQESRKHNGFFICPKSPPTQNLPQFHPMINRILASKNVSLKIGHILEDVIAVWLKNAGFDLQTHDESGEQFGFSQANGRIQSHVDGIINSGPIPKIPDTLGMQDHESSQMARPCKGPP
jgi:hypothetical protein